MNTFLIPLLDKSNKKIDFLMKNLTSKMSISGIA